MSPDGRMVVSGLPDGTSKISILGGPRAPASLYRGHTSQVRDVRFSRDGKRFVTASADGTARVWETQKLRDPLVLRGHEGSLNTARFSPDGKSVVTASEDRTARIWTIDSVTLLKQAERDNCVSSVEERVKFLGDSFELAQSRVRSCEIGYGRE